MREKPHILVVEDEPDLAELLVYNLRKGGYSAAAVGDGPAALRAVAESVPDLILLDVMLPGIPGTELAGRLRTNPRTATLPIIMLTAKADELDQLLGLAVGADDYITKPFSTKVLIARIDAVLRRATAPPAADPFVRLGPVEIDTAAHQARLDGRPLILTLTEFRLLLALIQARGTVLSRQALISRAMGPGITITARTIDVHMAAIRRKLGPHGRILRTVRGVGYRAALDPEPIGA